MITKAVRQTVITAKVGLPLPPLLETWCLRNGLARRSLRFKI